MIDQENNLIAGSNVQIELGRRCGFNSGRHQHENIQPPIADNRVSTDEEDIYIAPPSEQKVPAGDSARVGSTLQYSTCTG